MGGQRPATQLDRLAILQRHVGLHRLIVKAFALQERIAPAARRDDRPVGRAGKEFQPRRIALDLGQASGVVEVLMGVEQNFHLRGIKAQGPNVGHDLASGGCISAIQNDQAGL